MIAALPLAAVEVTLDGYHVETPDTYDELRASGFTSLSVRYVFPTNILKPDPEDDDAKPSAAPRRTIVVGVGRALRVPNVDGRSLQAFAVWAEEPGEVLALARAIGLTNAEWQNYAAKPSHLPMLEAPSVRGRWYVCYAADDAALPEGIELASDRRTDRSDARKV